MNNEEKKRKCIGWLMIGMLPQYIQREGQSVGVALKVLNDARQIVNDLDAAGELDTLMAAFNCQMEKK